MYFNREAQRWEGGDDVDMSGFEDSDEEEDEEEKGKQVQAHDGD